jgi:hypothetical protein
MAGQSVHTWLNGGLEEDVSNFNTLPKLAKGRGALRSYRRRGPASELDCIGGTPRLAINRRPPGEVLRANIC